MHSICALAWTPTHVLVGQTGPPADASAGIDYYPLIVLAVGIVSVLGLIIALKTNAFLALIIAALIVSLLAVTDDPGARVQAVAKAFGSSAGDIGIVIAMAAIIGKCMLDSGAADRIVRSAIRLTGVNQAPMGLMLSGFVLAVPVFFDTVFYLLVPLARSLYRRTSKNYLQYVMAIATGGAITHTLVPPTPGPLLVSANLGVDVGMMMLVGTMVAFPSALVGLMFSSFMNRVMPIPMRPLGVGEDKHEPLAEDQLPPLWISLLPVVLPVLLIGSGTVAMSAADAEDRARLTVGDIRDYDALRDTLRAAAADDVPTPADRVIGSAALLPQDRELLTGQEPLGDADRQRIVDALNRVLSTRELYDREAFSSVAISPVAQAKLAEDPVRMKPVDRRRMNRVLLEDAYPELIEPHVWDSPRRRLAERLGMWSNANFALLLAGIAAIATLKKVRGLSLRQLGGEVEESLMSGGLIILITAAGGAFGAMLKDARVGDSIQAMFEGSDGGGGGGLALLLLGFTIAAVLKVAQGSSTVAMIIGSGMIAGIVAGQSLGYHPVYLATAIGSGSLMGSWMNDSGFWVFAKMGGLTESESLRSWTILLVVLSLCGLVFTILFSRLLPLV